MNSKIIAFAIKAHADVNHTYDGHPYSVHLSVVAFYAQKYINIIPIEFQGDVIDACWLHDTIEDCRLTYNDVHSISNKTVAEIVYAVSNDKGRNRKERAGENYYLGIRNTPYATFVKLCDRLANVKYSLDAKSRMAEVYSKENPKFISSLFPLGLELENPYRPMIAELEQLLEQVGKIHKFIDDAKAI